jgi:hypothetical protein
LSKHFQDLQQSYGSYQDQFNQFIDGLKMEMTAIIEPVTVHFSNQVWNEFQPFIYYLHLIDGESLFTTRFYGDNRHIESECS